MFLFCGISCILCTCFICNKSNEPLCSTLFEGTRATIAEYNQHIGCSEVCLG